VLFVDDGQNNCDALAEATAAPPIAPAPVRNPETLLCQAGNPSCDPDCGPCPAATDLAPEVSWGICGSPCEQLSESDCAQNTQCRVVKNGSCLISGTCLRDYIGCFPTDTVTDMSIDCAAATDGQSCSRSNGCTALHELEACPTDAPCAMPFAMCIAEGTHPGKCNEPAICRSLPPPCPSGTTPGVANGCWTGACIPNEICESSL
jgi:hypothetical protein